MAVEDTMHQSGPGGKFGKGQGVEHDGLVGVADLLKIQGISKILVIQDPSVWPKKKGRLKGAVPGKMSHIRATVKKKITFLPQGVS
jgi:hypothetical protein